METVKWGNHFEGMFQLLDLTQIVYQVMYLAIYWYNRVLLLSCAKSFITEHARRYRRCVSKSDVYYFYHIYANPIFNQTRSCKPEVKRGSTFRRASAILLVFSQLERSSHLGEFTFMTWALRCVIIRHHSTTCMSKLRIQPCGENSVMASCDVDNLSYHLSI